MSGSILLIGASGLVGRHIRAALAGRPVQATWYRRPAPDAGQMDLMDAAAVRRMVGGSAAETVILAAAEAHVERCELEPNATRAVNVEAAQVVASAARERGARLVVFSSEYVFPGEGIFAEDDPVRPLNEYGRQKVALERIARGVERHLVCRTSAVYGWEPGARNFVSQLLGRLRAGRTMDVPSDQYVTPTYAPDLARAVVELIDGGRSGTYHVAGPRVLSRPQLASMAAQAFSLPERLVRARPTSELGLAAPRPLRCGLKVEKLSGVLGHGLRDPAEAFADMRASEGPPD